MSFNLPPDPLDKRSEFVARHVGIDPADERHMLQTIGAASRAALIETVVPGSIARRAPMLLPEPVGEARALAELRTIADHNRLLKSCIGQGYHGTHTPGVILRNVLENPAWYTAYTPYQAEISQGRLEAMMIFQTMVCDLTGLPIAGASLLDEATAAAEAMALALRVTKTRSKHFFVADDVLPQTLEVVLTRAKPLGITVVTGSAQDAGQADAFAVLLQYPGVTGEVHDLKPLVDSAHRREALVIVAADLLAMALLISPGELEADIAVGNTQRFGMPMGNGGPHAAYLATREEFKRSLPGRLVGISVDMHGAPAYRLALQTREQHIRREKATSNICTAQVLPAVVAGMYAVYHGPGGLRRIAHRVASYTAILAAGARRLGCELAHATAFDTVQLMSGARTDAVLQAAYECGYNLRRSSPSSVGITLDETTTRDDVLALWSVLAAHLADGTPPAQADELGQLWAQLHESVAPLVPASLARSSAFLTHPVFNTHHSETDMLRYLRSLADKDLALDRGMIPLGSCTMKLNASSEMIPMTWPQFAHVHPFAPPEQLAGYAQLREQLESWLGQITGYCGVSLQPNAGSQGEFAGLLAIKAFHESCGQGQRDICLIPESAHGTNPASAQMAGFKVVVVRCDARGNVDLEDLRAKCAQYSGTLATLMITYPSTYGVFDPQIRELCALAHQHGGRVYVDGANMNALVGLAAPGEFGSDVSHLNLHKTFCIPHGGGGPGVGPVCVVADLVPFLPAHHTAGLGSKSPVGAVSAAPLGNACVLPISWMYVRMMGAQGLRTATEIAILSANYIAARLARYYAVHFSGNIAGIKGGGVAHECILDLRPLKDTSGVTAEDVAKRLIDYGFHAPTLSFPVAGTLMVEPTESEPLHELDRFCEAMIAIRAEIGKVESGQWPQDDNPLKNAPHTATALLKSEWPHAYTREQAAFPVEALRKSKYWVPVARVDNVWGDRNLFCTCPALDAYKP
ncbi:MAG: aminomethyl-transferring glycine dehydrogenase [Burkholderiales bacterium]